MEKQEKELLERIRQQAEEMEIPMNVSPEVMEMRLRQNARKKKKRMVQTSIATAGLAAAVGIVCLVGIQGRQAKQNHNPVAEVVRKLSDVKMAESYEDVYVYLKRPENQNANNGGIFELLTSGGATKGDVMLESNMETEIAGTDTLVDGATSGTADYSQTNTRDAKVDEADIAKTDGRYLYVVSNEGNAGNEVHIIDTDGGKLRKIATIVPEECEQISEIYVKNNRLIALCQRAATGEDKTEYKVEMLTAVYDISNTSHPTLLHAFPQSGTYYTSRLYEDYLYVFSEFYVGRASDVRKPEEYVPKVNEEILPCGQICIPDTDTATKYTVITSINIKEPKEVKDQMAILSDNSMCYVSMEHIYMCDTTYTNVEGSTFVRKIAYKDGELEGKTKTKVKGYLKDSFCLDEYNEYLRMVVTLNGTVDAENQTVSNQKTNAVYVLDKDLEVIGEITGLAEDERVYSARFMGNVAYFVTFRETDPLFTVDLSDPKAPKIIGALKIPGFSEYLHPYGEGLLLGIGMQVDATGVAAREVKLSMFDISNPADVKEIDKCVLEGTYHSTAFQEYKSVTINADRNIIGFSAQGAQQKYYLYEYEKGVGFTCNMEENMMYSHRTRGLYIGDVFYLVGGNVIESYSLTDYQKIDDIAI